MISRKKVLMVWSPILLLVSLVVIYLLMSFIRGIIVPSYVSLFYTKSVTQNFNRDFTLVNNQLEASGYKFKAGRATCYNHVTDNGQNGYYQHFSETVPCIRLQSSNLFFPSEDFITQWKLSSSKLADLLKSAGWNSNQGNQSIANIFDGPPSSTVGVRNVYFIAKGKVNCSLEISYALYGSDTKKSTQIYESCERDVSFFGGSSG